MKRVLLLFGIMFSVLTAYAEENVLQSIEIVPIKDTYNIVLTSDKVVDVKKTIQDSNKISLSMKDIRASKTLNTVYNNASNVDSVIVEPQGNGVNIFFQAENASAAKVSFDNLVSNTPVKASTQNLKLNNPIESYAPIYNEVYEEAKTSSLFDKLKASSTPTIENESLTEFSKTDITNKTVSFSLVGLLAFAVIRLFRRREPEMKIGLSQSLTDREISLHKNALAQQQVNNFEKPYSTINYGLNAYQKENRNPYETTPTQFHNPRLREYATQTPAQEFVAQQPVSRVAQTQTMAISQPQVKKMTTPVNSAPVNQSNPNIDNLKFLESMTAIYEKSGRHDLARGLKASLNKNLK